MIQKIYNYLKNLHNKGLLLLIYLFLLSPLFITFILNKNIFFYRFLDLFITIITALSFIAIISVYYYNFFIDKRENKTKFTQTTHLKKIFFSYLYIICIFANLFYMAQYAQNISNIEKVEKTNFYFNFNSNEKAVYKDNLYLFIDCIYLSITTITTIGYGEVIPGHVYGKFLIAIEAMLGQIMWGLSMTLWFVKK